MFYQTERFFNLTSNQHMRGDSLMSNKFDLMDTMTDALDNFYEKNDLQHLCALDSQIVGNYKTPEQR